MAGSVLQNIFTPLCWTEPDLPTFFLYLSNLKTCSHVGAILFVTWLCDDPCLIQAYLYFPSGADRFLDILIRFGESDGLHVLGIPANHSPTHSDGKHAKESDLI